MAKDPQAPASPERGVSGRLAAERLEIEQRLRRREEELARVQRIGGIGGVDIDVSGGMRSIRSPEYLRLHGLSADAVHETHEQWLQRVHPDDRARADRTLRAALREGSSYESEYRIIRASDGEVRWISAKADVERDAQGHAVRLVGAHIDITRLRQAEDSMRESELRSRKLIETYSQATWETDAAGCVVQDSPSWRAYTGQTLEEWLGHGWVNAIHPDDRACAERQWREAVAARQPVNAEFRLRHPPDGWRWTNVRAIPLIGPDAEIQKWIGMNIDIHARREAEAALRASEERQAFLLSLSDSLRPLSDATEIQHVACRMLRAHLQASVATWAEAVSDDEIEVTGVDQDPSVVDVRGRYSLSAYGYDVASEMRMGRVSWRNDIASDPLYSDAHKAALTSLGCIAWANAPLVKGGRLSSMLTVHYPTAHEWSESELSVIGEVAERTWSAAVRARAEAAVRKSEERLQALVSASSHVIYRMNADWSEMCQLSGGGFVADTPSPERDWLDKYILAEDQRGLTSRVSDAVARKSTIELEHRIRRADGSVGWAYSRAVPLLDEHGEVQEWFGTATDITARKQAEERLREREQQLRQFGEASSDILWIRDAQKLQWEYLSSAFEKVYGLSREAALHGDTLQNWADLIVAEDRELALANINRVRAGEQVVFEYRVRRPCDGEIRWLRNSDFPIVDGDGRVRRIGGIGHDATEEKATAHRMELMVAELQHRTRNLIAVIRAIAQQTMMITGPTPAFQEQFSDRLAALARVQGLLSRSDEEPITIDGLIRMELDALGAKHTPRIALEGPSVSIRPSVVQTLALALHELATNARKYGALADGKGRLHVKWDVMDGDGKEPRLVLDWIEEGMDGNLAAQDPDRIGYGRELIERALPYSLAARTRFELDNDGVRCRIDLPLSSTGRMRRDS